MAGPTAISVTDRRSRRERERQSRAPSAKETCVALLRSRFAPGPGCAVVCANRKVERKLAANLDQATDSGAYRKSPFCPRPVPIRSNDRHGAGEPIAVEIVIEERIEGEEAGGGAAWA
jgi:hypothetical protein